MTWWQILLIGVVTIVAGVAFGAFFIYLERQLSRRRQRASMADQRLEGTVPPSPEGAKANLEITTEPWTGKLLRFQARTWQALQGKVSKLPANLDGLLNSSRKRSAGRAEKTSAIRDQAKDSLPALLEEVESNLQIAAKPWAGELFSFQTRIGDTLQDKANTFPANLQGSLAQIYIDIRLANSIVRLSQEFNRRSPNLDESYMKLCTSITEKINRIKPLMERLQE
jgi:hypothetical protein